MTDQPLRKKLTARRKKDKSKTASAEQKPTSTEVKKDANK